MLDGDTFDALEFVARSIRGVDAPFGGVRLVLSGDFFQVKFVFSFRSSPPQPVSFHVLGGGNIFWFIMSAFFLIQGRRGIIALKRCVVFLHILALKATGPEGWVS